MNIRKIIFGGLIAVLVICSSFQFIGAKSPSRDLENEDETASVISNEVPIQGRLTDSSGNPISGNVEVTFTWYDAETGGTALRSETKTISVTNGLFSTSIPGEGMFEGEQVYLGMKVGTDEEMTPRQPIYAVPYALGLRPGALITGNTAPVLGTESTALIGIGLSGIASSPAGLNTGVYGESRSPDGFGGYFMNTAGGAALIVDGSLQSKEKSYIWISGNNLRKKFSTDTTEFELDLYGGALVRRASVANETRDVMLPVTLPGQLYGQDVTLTGIDIYFKSQGDFDGISVTAIRRQNGAGSGDIILRDTATRVCVSACSYHLSLTQNNVLNSEQGAVYIAFQLFFGGDSTYVQIGGVRLTLEHD